MSKTLRRLLRGGSTHPTTFILFGPPPFGGGALMREAAHLEAVFNALVVTRCCVLQSNYDWMVRKTSRM
ncbi:hypothetical protein BN2476_110020 [Paraburkholderia piptadeniae]|uniref:Uncharacterized protein n=1 Tax=Paraburkholderia piptadeniae TaxID=1701573 RepID=A0A1N7RP78_9BURK|nr:hypothetical protein BN2476_110020 [Paraburkholderia piptadeniae]